MTADKAGKDGKLTGLNHTLTSVENELLRKRVARSDKSYFDLLRHSAASEPAPELPADDGDGTE